MSVVVHDFELLVESPSTPRQKDSAEPPPPEKRQASTGIRPLEIRDALAHQVRRAIRVSAD